MQPRTLCRAFVSCLAAVAGSSGVGVAVASADTVLAPTNDTYVASATPATNFAGATLLAVTGTPASQALLRFTAPSGAIAGGKLRLYATASSSDAITVRRSSCAWTTTTVTWNTRPALGAAIASKSSVSAGWNDIALPATAVSSGAATCLQVTKASGARAVRGRAQHLPRATRSDPRAPLRRPHRPRHQRRTGPRAHRSWEPRRYGTATPSRSTRTGVHYGGEGALPSYQWSSASGPAGGSSSLGLQHRSERARRYAVPNPAGLNRTQ